MLTWTGERYVPWLREATISYEHLHRYAYATQFVQDKRVLDLACGEGYGSYLLAKSAKSVVGIDIDEASIKHASNKYIKDNLRFKVGSITKVPIEGERLFDIIVCFEALEHIQDHQKLLGEVKRLLAPEGLFVVSTPNKWAYSDEPDYNNPFHLHELYFDEFKELLEKQFNAVKFLGQRIYCTSNIWPVLSESNEKCLDYVIERSPNEFAFVEKDKRIPLYFIAVASDATLQVDERSSRLIDISDSLLNEKDEQIAAQRSEQERLGREVTQLQLTVRSQAAERDGLISEITQLQSSVRSQVAERDKLISEIIQLQSTARSQEEALSQKAEEFRQLVAERERLGHDANQFQSTAQAREEYIRAIEDSLAWTLITRYRRARDKLFPHGTMRSRSYGLLKDLVHGLFQRELNALTVTPEKSSQSKEMELDLFRHPERQKKNGPFELEQGMSPIEGMQSLLKLDSPLQFSVYTSSLGNYFFNEIRDLIATGLEQLGFKVTLRNEKDGFTGDVDWHLVVAPHEFFYLGDGEKLRWEDSPKNLIFLNTEQQSTQWFARAFDCFSKAHSIWDINHESSELLLKKGFKSYHLPLGYLPGFKLFEEVEVLPKHYGTCFLEPEIREHSYVNEPLGNRPIDVLFVGHLSARRDQFFTQAASSLSRYCCYLFYWDVSSPAIPSVNTYMDTATAIGLARRSKIVLNIRHGEGNFFEWHRIVMHGIWQRALVITEPCSSAPPFRAGFDFVEAPINEISEKISYYLSSAEGVKEAETIANHGFRTLAERCRLTDSLCRLILQLYISRSNDKFWQSVGLFS